MDFYTDLDFTLTEDHYEPLLKITSESTCDYDDNGFYVKSLIDVEYEPCVYESESGDPFEEFGSNFNSNSVATENNLSGSAHNNFNEIVASYPYLKSDYELHDEVIDISNDDDDYEPRVCFRCPPNKRIKNRELFLVHVERHMGECHFSCPDCLKQFVSLPLCLAHEIRCHDREFDFDHPFIRMAYEYRRHVLSKKSQLATNGQDEIYLTDEETDEDDPKFYPDHGVPSTSLYPYRGPSPVSRYDCYELHLKFGRERRTPANTISRSVLARRRQLISDGRISESEVGRFWNPQQGRKVKEIRISCRKRKRDKDSSDNETTATTDTNSASELPTKVNDLRRPKKRKVVSGRKGNSILNRTFVNSIITRLCVLCNYEWSNEEDLRRHRAERHPTNSMVDLMTVHNPNFNPPKYISSDSDSDSSGSSFSGLFRPILSSKETSIRLKRIQTGPSTSYGCVPQQGSSSTNSAVFQPINPTSPKEQFLESLGLISKERYDMIMKRPATKQCSVKLLNCFPNYIPKNGRVYVCSLCPKKAPFFSITKKKLREHKTEIHPKKEKKIPKLVLKLNSSAPVSFSGANNASIVLNENVSNTPQCLSRQSHNFML